MERLVLSGCVDVNSWLKVSDKTRIVCLDSVGIRNTPHALFNSVNQIWLTGRCFIDSGMFSCFPNLKKIWFRGTVDIVGEYTKIPVDKIEFTDYGGSLCGVLDYFRPEYLCVSGNVGELSESILSQSRIVGLELQDTKLELSEHKDLLKRLIVLSLARVNQKDYQWISELSAVKMLSLSHLSALSDLSSIGCLKQLRILGLESQKKTINIDCISRANNLVALGLCNVGRIPSIEWIKDFEKLRYLSILGDSYIEDCQVSFLRNLGSLEYINIQKKRAYDSDPNIYSKLSVMEGMMLFENEVSRLRGQVE